MNDSGGIFHKHPDGKLHDARILSEIPVEIFKYVLVVFGNASSLTFVPCIIIHDSRSRGRNECELPGSALEKRSITALVSYNESDPLSLLPNSGVCRTHLLLGDVWGMLGLVSHSVIIICSNKSSSIDSVRTLTTIRTLFPLGLESQGNSCIEHKARAYVTN